MKLIDFSVTLIFTVLNIGILFVVLRAIFFKPVTKFIESRTQKIQGELDRATSEREESKRLLASYEEKISASNSEIRAMTEKSRRAAEKRGAAIVAEAKEQAESLIEAARKQIIAEKQAALLAFRAEAAGLVMRAASRLIKREIKSEDAQRLAQAALAEAAKL